jgi:serine/threonine-protein kinase
MDSPSACATLICPRDEPPTTTPGGPGTGLSTHLVTQAAVRLRILAYLYAFTFFMAAFLPALLFPADRALLFSRPTLWAPGVIGIAVALLVAAVTKSPRVSLHATMAIGLIFEVVSSYGIAAAEFLDTEAFNMSGHFWMGLSWVAVWTLLFTVVVPTSPRKAVPAALASVSAVPVTIGFLMARQPTAFHPSPMQFFFWLVFPYLLVVVMAYVGARVVYALGKEVTRSRELGSYRLVERLGQGGMGEVWRAQHRMLARPAAIKLIRPAATGNGKAVASTEMRRRFEREAQATASLRSPHTVSLFDFGVSDDGTFYYVMELLEGLTAEALVQRYGQLPFKRAIYVLRQMCHSLSEADARGLVHRDIKPANIFLCRYGEEFDFVKVLDFGLVTALNEQPDGAMTLTREHAIHGTPAFIAPEQALGVARLDGRADIYATGCVAYWLLTGQLVFKAETPLELILHHAHTVPDPPSNRTELPIPPALDQLVMACLAKSPAERPQSARELSQRLAEIAGPDAWTEVEAREWWAIHEPSLLPPNGRPRTSTPRP